MPSLQQTDPLDSRQFVIAIKRLADSLSYGTDRSPFLGSGLEYVQSRPYVPGDPVKTIDWRVTARTGVPHIKEYETPKQLPVWFVVDSSASMTLSSTKLSKYQLAVQIAGGLALACLDRVSPVGLMAAGSRDLKISPSLSRETLLLWLHQLRHFDFVEKTQLGEKLLALNPSLKQRSLIFVLSDLHDPEAIPALKLVNGRHDLVTILLRDPAEDGLAGAGILRARDAESARTVTAPAKHQFASTADAVADLQGASIDHFLLRTDQPFLAALRLFLQSRNLLSR
ncbi:DUF58 domain-containing protein [Roseibacillus persicicus]|uniref:DUF58 domain-containing protein n=1 Tax=Roseibacillus persicicus TaxID=454148 RepID=A0A918TLL6_9BACT|nr:DUF58 domain-containing protein [Roseibacillus persicicus]GHC51362.1 hypothetical protein GCM10007100_16960 [Roseibacillus persicicus]